MLDLNQLKRQISEKDLKIYELELLVKELKTEVKELHDAKDKLKVSNRNARVLEEENNNLIMKLKCMSDEKMDLDNFLSKVEGVKLIDENNQLRDSLEKMHAEAKRICENASAVETKFQKELLNLSKDRDMILKERQRLENELATTRQQCAELQISLNNEREVSKASVDIWAREKERYEQKLKALLEGGRREKETHSISREPHSGLQSEEVPLSQLLLKEEVAQLEMKLKDSEEELWRKEKEWILTETALRAEIATLIKHDDGIEKEKYRALQAQVAAIKKELLTFREKKPEIGSVQNLSFLDMDTESTLAENVTIEGENDRDSALGIPSTLQASSDAAQILQQQVASLRENNYLLTEELDKLKASILQAQTSIEEKDLQCKELKVQLAKMHSNSQILHLEQLSDHSRNPSKNYEGGGSIHSNMDTKSHSQTEVEELKQQVKDLQIRLNDFRVAHREKETINTVRSKEHEDQIDALLAENEDLRRSLDYANAKNQSSLLDHSSGEPNPLMILSNNARDSVRDIMHALETAWAHEEEAVQHAKKVKLQFTRVESNDSFRRNEIHHLQEIIEDLQNQLKTTEFNHKAINMLRDDLDQKNAKIEDLTDEIKNFRRRLRSLDRHSRANSRRSAYQENEKLNERLRDLESAVLERNTRAVTDRNADEIFHQQLKPSASEVEPRRHSRRATHSESLSPAHIRTPTRSRYHRVSPRRCAPENSLPSHISVQSPLDHRKNVVSEGAHLAFTVVELANLMREGRAITDPGSVIIKLKSIKEKYKTSLKELATVIRFGETFEFQLAKPDQDVIALHIFYKSRGASRQYHIGDACFSMATLSRSFPRRRIVPIVHNSGTENAHRVGKVEVILFTDDFGKRVRPTDAEIEDERLRFDELVKLYESSFPEKLHAVDVYMASNELR